MTDFDDFDDVLDGFQPIEKEGVLDSLSPERRRDFFLEVMTESEGPTLARFEDAHRIFQDLVEQLRSAHERDQIVDPDLMEATKMAQQALEQAKLSLDESFRRTQYRMDRVALA